MKRLLSMLAVLCCVFPALGAYRFNPISTNTPAGMTNVILDVAAAGTNAWSTNSINSIANLSGVGTNTTIWNGLTSENATTNKGMVYLGQTVTFTGAVGAGEGKVVVIDQATKQIITAAGVGITNGEYSGNSATATYATNASLLQSTGIGLADTNWVLNEIATLGSYMYFGGPTNTFAITNSGETVSRTNVFTGSTAPFPVATTNSVTGLTLNAYVRHVISTNTFAVIEDGPVSIVTYPFRTGGAGTVSGHYEFYVVDAVSNIMYEIAVGPVTVISATVPTLIQTSLALTNAFMATNQCYFAIAFKVDSVGTGGPTLSWAHGGAYDAHVTFTRPLSSATINASQIVGVLSPANVGPFTNHSDVTIAGLAAGDHLAYDGSVWTNGPVSVTGVTQDLSGATNDSNIALAIAVPSAHYVTATNGYAAGQGSLDHPWTLAYALANVPASNTLIFLPGTYAAINLTALNQVGVTFKTSSKWGSSFSTNGLTLGFTSAAGISNVVIDGWEIRYASENGVKIMAPGWTVKNCWIHNTGNAASVYDADGYGTIIENNLMEYGGAPWGDGYAVGLYLSGTNGIVRGNVIRHNTGHPIQVFTEYAGDFAYGWHIYNNLCYANVGSLVVTVAANPGPGIDLTNWVYANTIISSNMNYALQCNGGWTYATNNILQGFDNDACEGAVNSFSNTCFLDYNLFTNDVSASFPLFGGTIVDGGHNVVDTDPEFVNTANGLYWLTATSPARNIALSTIFGVVDFWQRPVASISDVGAFQYQVGLASDTRILDPVITGVLDYWSPTLVYDTQGSTTMLSESVITNLLKSPLMFNVTGTANGLAAGATIGEADGSALTNLPTASIVVATTNSTAAARAVATYICNGTNDTAQIISAVVDSADVYIATGDYYVSNVVVSGKSNFTIRGGGHGTVLHLVTNLAVAAHALHISECTNFVVRDLTARAHWAQQGNTVATDPINAMTVSQSQGGSILNCDLGDADQALSVQSSSRILISGCELHDNQNKEIGGHILNFDVWGAGLPGNSDIIVSDCQIFNASQNSCKVEQTSGFQFTGNSVRSYTGTNNYTFVFGPNENPPEALNSAFLVSGNMFYNPVQFALSDTNLTLSFSQNVIKGGDNGLVISASALIPAQARSVVIAGNEIYDCNNAGIAAVSDPVYGDWVISNNRIVNCNDGGIRLLVTNIANLTIQDNTIVGSTNVSGVGIQLRSGLAQVVNNRISWTNALSTTIGIDFDNQYAGTNRFSGNVFINANKAIYVNGSNNVVEGNLCSGVTTFIQESNSDQNRLFNNMVPGITTFASRGANDGKLDWEMDGGNGIFVLGGDGSAGSTGTRARTEDSEKTFTIACVPKNIANKPISGLTMDAGSGAGNLMYLGGASSANYGLPQRIIASVGSGVTSTGAGTIIFSARGSGLNVGADSTPNSTLTVEGSFALRYLTKITNYTCAASDSIIGVGVPAAGITITLPTAASIPGRHYTIQDQAGQAPGTNVTIATTSSQTINGAAPFPLTNAYQCITVYSDGANWLLKQ